jgi:purine-binding chemotaxis protein CheW
MGMAMKSTMNVSATQPMEGLAGKYLIFQLGEEEFGTSVLKVKEIMKMQEITLVPQTPAFMQGVINLRGKIIPVINLRSKFGLMPQENTDITCIVVVRIQLDGREQPMGIVVDAVVEVMTLSGEDIEDAPDFGMDDSASYVMGMAKIKGKVKILLDIDRVLSGSERDRLSLVR